MNIIKTIKRFYIVFTVYVIAIYFTTTLGIMDLFPALILMWILFGFLFIGHKISKYSNSNKSLTTCASNQTNSILLTMKKKNILFIALTTILASIAVTNYYTGQTPISLFINLLEGNSLYYQYQYFFQQNNIGQFSISKIPYILLLVYIKFILIYSYISLLLLKTKTSKTDKIYLFLITASTAYFAIARGTNFEFFEILILITYITFTKLGKIKSSKIKIRNLLIILILSLLMIYVYYISIEARGVTFNKYISKDVVYDPRGLVPQISMLAADLVVILFGYFGFGFFYVSRFITDIWMNSIGSLIAGFFPLGIKLITFESTADSMIKLIDMGAKWHPDTAIIIDYLGFLGLIVLIFILGIFSGKIENDMKNKKTSLLYITNYFIVLQMISNPIGNFIRVSSSNTIIVIMLITVWIWKVFKLPRIIFYRGLR